MEKYLERLIELRSIIAELEKEEKEIKQQLLDEWLNKEVCNWYMVYRTVKYTTKLKEWINKDDIIIQYPDCIKTTIDIDKLSKHPETVSMIDITESQFLTIKKQNGNNKS